MIWIALGLLIHFEIINRASPLVSSVYSTLGRILEPMLSPIRRFSRKYLPFFNGVDISPIILWLILRFIRIAVVSTFYIDPLLSSAGK